MSDLILLIVTCTFFAHIIYKRTFFFTNCKIGIQKDVQSKICYIFLLCSFILFSGLRSTYNDTETYMQGFEIIRTNDINIIDYLCPYGGFKLYQTLIKMYISENSQILIFISAIVTNLLYINFILSYSKKFSESIYLYCIDDYIFSMAGIKQSIAMGISLYVLRDIIEKKYIKACVLLLLAMWFHPYIICLVCVIFLRKKIWDKNVLFIIFLFSIFICNLERVLYFFSLIGQEYTVDTITSYSINPIRILIMIIPILISFLYRKRINKVNDKILIIGINMRIMSFIFLCFSLVMNPIYLGRIAGYFEVLSSIIIPKMLDVSFYKNRNRKIYKLIYYIFWGMFFFFDMTKIGKIGFFTDQFNHIKIWKLFI